MRQARKVNNAELPHPKAGAKGRQKKHQPISEGISQELHIRSSHTGPQKIADKKSFHVTTYDMMVAEQVWP